MIVRGKIICCSNCLEKHPYILRVFQKSGKYMGKNTNKKPILEKKSTDFSTYPEFWTFLCIALSILGLFVVKTLLYLV